MDTEPCILKEMLTRLLVVQMAIEAASQGATILIRDDTGLLVLLCFHADTNSHPLYFRSEGNQAREQNRIWHVNELRWTFGPETCHLLPFVHALSGCNTTLQLYGIGERAALRKLTIDASFRNDARVFTK